jgi:enolase
VTVADTTIVRVTGRRVLAVGGAPALEAEVHLHCGASGRAVVPIGSARGRTAHCGVHEIASVVDAALHGLDARRHDDVDASLTRLNTYSPTRVGTEVLAACSIGALRAAAEAAGQPLYRYLQPEAARVPLVMATVFECGAPATELGRLSVLPLTATGAEEALDACAAIHAAALLRESSAHGAKSDTRVPVFQDDERGLELLIAAIERAGFVPGGEIAIAAELNAGRVERINSASPSAADASRHGRRGELLASWIERFPIVALEDRFAADERAPAESRSRAGFGSLLRVGAFAAHDAEADPSCNRQAHRLRGAIVAAPEQAGTASEVLAAFDAARRAGWDTAVAADVAGTEDGAAVHLAVGWGAGILKLGSVADAASAARWNELLRIDSALRPGASHARILAAARRVH